LIKVSSTLGASFIVSGLLEIIIPLGIGFYITRKFGTSWKNWFIGALMFLLSLVRIPLNAYANQVLFAAPVTAMTYILATLVSSLTAGIFEEVARYVGLKYIIKDETFEKGLTYGAGHGGIESIFLVGLSVLSVGVVLLTSSEVLPPEQLEMILATPVYLPLVGVYERVMAMIAQIGFSLIVLESLRKKDLKFLLAAIGLHASLNFLAVSVVGNGIIYSEIIVTGFALGLGYWAFNKLRNEGVIG
jgi:uncharacterized membrane protein YhfC